MVESKANKRKKSNLTELVVLMSAIVIASAGLVFTAEYRIDLENLAKGAQNSSRREELNGNPFTAYTIRDIKALADDRNIARNHNINNPSTYRILWLGNSQLHYINQYRRGDHLSPYWLRVGWKPPPMMEPLGCSLPNASFQEFLILSRYVFINVPIHLLLIELVFDDLREDGLRSDFAEILLSHEGEQIRNSSLVADALARRFFMTGKASGEHEDNNVLAGTTQQPVEQWLNRLLSHVWNLWANRPQIEGNVYLAVYNIRNFVFGIKPTTIRRMIPIRYDSNMEALRDILVDCQRRRISVLLYISPIRQDKPIPYDAVEYNRWKVDVADMAKQHDACLVNLERLIPGTMWGSYTGDNVDFMHFQGPGHRLVAEALLPHIRQLIEDRGH
jgi:hypothetical protein